MPRGKRRPVHKVLYALYDARDEWAGTYRSRVEAMDDAWGPRFRPIEKVTVREYVLVTRKQERK